LKALNKEATQDSKLRGIITRLKNVFSRDCLKAFIMVNVLLLVFVVLYAVVMSYLSLVKYYTFHATAWDLGVFSQSMYTTLNFNKFFYNNLELGSHFHVHFSPILFLCLPFYAINQNSTTLLVLQAIVVALGGVPLYFLAKKEFESSKHSVAFIALYFLYPALHGANLFDFHPEAFIPLLGFSALYFYKNEKWGRYFIFLMALLMVKEDMPLIAIGIGLCGFFSNIKLLLKKKINKTLIIALLTIFIGIAWLFLAFSMVSYFVRLDGYESLWDYGYSHHTMNVYGEFGKGGPLNVFSYMISNPLESIAQISNPPSQKLIFIAALFLPVCMLAFLDIPHILLFLPTLLELMFASNPYYFDITYHYPFQLAPTIFVATIYGIRKICMINKQMTINTKTLTHVLLTMAIATLITLLFTTQIIMQNIPLTVNKTDEIKNKVISLIPMDTNPSILTQNDYFPHVCNSIYSYAYWNTTSVDYILIDVCSFWYHNQIPAPDEYIAKYGEPKGTFASTVKAYIDSGEFGLLAQANSLLLYKRGYEGNLSIYFPYTRTINWQELYFINATIISDSTAVSKKILLHNASSGFGETFWYGPYIGVPPGEYEVRFRLKIANLTDEYILSLDVFDYSHGKVLAKSIITGYNFSSANTWQELILPFKLDELATQVEFRGLLVSNTTDIYLDYIALNQTAPLIKFLGD
jgi:uncharacterized membrane protein